MLDHGWVLLRGVPVYLGGRGRVGPLRGVAFAINDGLLRMCLVFCPKQVVVGGGELDDRRVLAGTHWCGSWSLRARVDQDGAVGVRDHGTSLLIGARAAAQAFPCTREDNGWTLVVEAGFLSQEVGAKSLA